MLCIFSGCTNLRNKKLTFGYCGSHMNQWYKYGRDASKLVPIKYKIKDESIAGQKTCRMCLQSKDLEDFYTRNASLDGKSLYCIPCEKAKKLRNTYGISVEEVLEKLQDQKGLCMVCEKTDITDCWCIDHNHKTGEVRGLLCSPCNLMLGLAQDDPVILYKAMNYLQGWESNV